LWIVVFTLVIFTGLFAILLHALRSRNARRDQNRAMAASMGIRPAAMTRAHFRAWLCGAGSPGLVSQIDNVSPNLSRAISSTFMVVVFGE
jgi:branched-subunit amino acid ABC-type transport system permease component